MLMENAVRMKLFGRLSGRRLFRELVLCLSEEKPLPVLKRLRDFGLLDFFYPGLKIDRPFETRFQRLEGVMSWYRLLFTGEKFEPWVTAFLGLVDGMTEKDLEDLLVRFSLPGKYRNSFLQRRRMAIQVAHRLLSRPSPGRSEVFFLLNPLPADFLLYAMGRTEEEAVKKAISMYFTELKRVKVSLSGKDLKKMGFVPGPIYAEILQAVLRARLEGKISSRQEEIDLVLKRYDPRPPSPAEKRTPRLPHRKGKGELRERTSPR
jgi:tRNA nucleotidyltransferase (CCA-adding enzyme)